MVKCMITAGDGPTTPRSSAPSDHGLNQMADLPPSMVVETFGPNVDTDAGAFVDTAAIMDNLDLIITSDTSIAHLAGALGRPVWILLQKVPDWRWGLEGDDCPWYPTARLCRQAVDGDWAVPVAQAADRLCQAMLAENAR